MPQAAKEVVNDIGVPLAWFILESIYNRNFVVLSILLVGVKGYMLMKVDACPSA